MSTASLWSRRPDLLPSLGIALGGVLWGLFWLPLRWLGDLGLEGPWPGLVIYAACGLVLLPFLPRRLGRLRGNVGSLALTGLFTGTAFAAYASSILLTEVVRTLLLFYLTPVWSTLLGLAFLGERLTRTRLAALILGFAGLLVVLGLGEGFPWPRNLGDWLALLSGVAWAYGSMRLYREGGLAVFEQILVFVLGGFAVLVLAILLGGEIVGPSPAGRELLEIAPHAFAISIFVLPMLFLTIWPAMRLSPARVGLLLMGEVVVGVGSAALLAGEPFGVRELLGTALILAAGAIEVLGRPTAKGGGTPEAP
jgi:drug/metabolite transporter (DMT)-like permease